MFQSKSNISRWIYDDDFDSNSEVDYLPWAYDQPNGFSSQKCMSFDSNRSGYNDEECSSKYCSPCQLPKDIYFHLRGLSIDLQDILDIDYILYMDSARVSFDGFSGISSIILDPFSKNWEIISFDKVIGYYNQSKNYPIGLFTWDFFLEKNLTVDLKLSQVRK